MIEFDAGGALAPGYLATPDTAAGSGTRGVVVLHAWWGLTEPFREVCDRLAATGFVALAPDLYRGKTTAAVEEAEALGAALDQEVERWRGDIAGAGRFLRHYGEHNAAPAADADAAAGAATAATHSADGGGTVALVGFSLGGAYALDMSVTLAEQIAAVVVFYDAYADPDYRRAQAAYLCHFAEDDRFLPVEKVAALEHALQAAGRPVSIYTYPGTRHWFFEANRPDAYDATAAALAWERTLAFLNSLNSQLRRA